MSGNELFDEKYIAKIQYVIDKNKDKPYLVGFKNFIADKSYSTIYAYLSHICKFMKTVEKEPEDLVLDDFTMYIADQKRRTSSYQIVVYTALKFFSEYLKAAKINMDDYMQYKKRPANKEGLETKKKREQGFLEKDEIQEYLKQIHEGVGGKKARVRQENWYERDMCIIMMFLNTGMRCSALWKLDVDNIDLKNKKLVTIDKGDKVQEYPLSDDLVRVIEGWLALRMYKLNEVNKIDETALFISNRFQRMGQISISRVVTKYSVNIKGKHITPHKLRATAITSVYEATGDLYVAQQFAGHANPTITANTYIRGKKDIARKTGSDIMSGLTKLNV